MKSWRSLSAIAILSSLSIGTSAIASTLWRHDGNDANGRLDIKAVSHSHSSDGQELIHVLRTFKGWKRSALEDNLSLITFFFYFDGELRREIKVDVDDSNRLRATIHDSDSGRRIGRARVSKPNARTIKIQFDPDDLGKQVSAYRWSAASSWHGDGHKKCDEDEHGFISCVDPAPDRDRIRHRV